MQPITKFNNYRLCALLYYINLISSPIEVRRISGNFYKDRSIELHHTYIALKVNLELISQTLLAKQKTLDLKLTAIVLISPILSYHVIGQSI